MLRADRVAGLRHFATHPVEHRPLLAWCASHDPVMHPGKRLTRRALHNVGLGRDGEHLAHLPGVTRLKGLKENRMKRYLAATAAAALFAGVSVAAQGTTSTAQSASTKGPTTTLTGCVYKEKDVPGRAPNVAERVGILEDYILAEVNTPPAAGTAGATGTAGTTAASGSHPMYKLELIEDSKLSAMVGKRIEVTGHVDAEAGDATGRTPTQPTSPTDKVIGRDRVNLPEFEVVSMREVAGSCPATPTTK